MESFSNVKLVVSIVVTALLISSLILYINKKHSRCNKYLVPIFQLFSTLCLVSFVSYIYNGEELAKWQSFLDNKTFLYPPTLEEEQKYDELYRQVLITQKEIELEAIKSGKNEDEAKDESLNRTVDDYMDVLNATPAGHNPPPYIVENKIAELKQERTDRIRFNIGITAIIFLALIFYRKRFYE